MAQKPIKDENKINEKNKTTTDKVAKQTENNTTENLESKIVNLETQLNIITAEKEDWQNRSLRAVADLQNLSKQAELDNLQSKKSSKKQVINIILPFLNTINLAFAHSPKSESQDVKQFIETLQSSLNRLISDLNNISVEIVIPEVGQEFNPEFMNILNGDKVEGLSEIKVLQVVSCGVKIDNQVIQPANILAEGK